jgi:MFS family permease
MIVVVAPLSGRFSARFGPRLFVVAGLLLCSLAIYGLSLLGPSSPYSAIWPWLVIFGVGAALAMPVLAATVVADVDEAKAGVASGVLNTARQLGTALGVAVLGSIGATVARSDWAGFAAGLPAGIQSRAEALAPLVVLGQGGTIDTLVRPVLGPVAAALASSRALDAFCHGMEQAFVAAAAVGVVAAALAVVGLASKSVHGTDIARAQALHDQ